MPQTCVSTSALADLLRHSTKAEAGDNTPLSALLIWGDGCESFARTLSLVFDELGISGCASKNQADDTTGLAFRVLMDGSPVLIAVSRHFSDLPAPPPATPVIACEIKADEAPLCRHPHDRENVMCVLAVEDAARLSGFSLESAAQPSTDTPLPFSCVHLTGNPNVSELCTLNVLLKSIDILQRRLDAARFIASQFS